MLVHLTAERANRESFGLRHSPILLSQDWRASGGVYRRSNARRHDKSTPNQVPARNELVRK